MANLIEKKKEDRRFRIQSASIELFSTIGFEATTIAKIAEKANLGVGTFYNYYKSKDEVLLSIISDKTGQFTENFNRAIENRTNDILYSVNLLIDVYYNSFSIYNKLIWRKFISNIFQKQHSTIKAIMEIDSLFINKLEELFHCLKDNNIINRAIYELTAAKTIYNIMVFQLLMYTLDADMTIENSRKALDDQLKIVISGLR